MADQAQGHGSAVERDEPSISCHMTADQARWHYYTYLVATRCPEGAFGQTTQRNITACTLEAPH